MPDGTNVTIAPNSSVTIDKTFGRKNRILCLKGSAYFSVSHQEELPLVIDAGKVFIKDIGTKFNIVTSADTDTVYVSVDEGVVLLFDSLITIRQSEKAMYIKSSRKIQSLVSAQPQAKKLDFVNARLIDVIDRLSKEYNIHIEMENKLIGNCKITTRFSNEDIETILSVITETMEFEYEKTTKGYLIKGNKCIE